MRVWQTERESVFRVSMSVEEMRTAVACWVRGVFDGIKSSCRLPPAHTQPHSLTGYDKWPSGSIKQLPVSACGERDSGGVILEYPGHLSPASVLLR